MTMMIFVILPSSSKQWVSARYSHCVTD